MECWEAPAQFLAKLLTQSMYWHITEVISDTGLEPKLLTADAFEMCIAQNQHVSVR
mgnify:CR=1 FL=1